MTCERSSRYFSQQEPVAIPTASIMLRSGKSVAPKNVAQSDVSHLLAPTSSGKRAAMQSSRCASIEPTSLSTRGLEAGARFEVLTTAKPLGVSTMSSEGMARRRASATTRRAVRILTGLESVYPQMVLNVLSPVKVILTQSSARSRKSASLSIKGFSPLTEAMMLGIWARSCASVVISFIGVWEFYLFSVLVFVERC